VRRESALMTDEASWYKAVGREFASHGRVAAHRFRNVRGDITTNMVEGYFSIFKRGMKCVCQHCSEKHLLLLAEFGFRYSHRVALVVAFESHIAEIRNFILLSRFQNHRDVKTCRSHCTSIASLITYNLSGESMPMPAPGEKVFVPAKVEAGAFSGERLVTVHTQSGPVAKSDFIMQDRDGHYLLAEVKNVTEHGLMVFLFGSFFTTTGLANLAKSTQVKMAG
jgi:ISXO2-like transposase domain